MGDDSLVFQISGLQVNYGFRCAVESLSLELPRGRSLGLLGVNGAGKTSTIRALLGMIRPRKGSVTVFGRRPGSPAVLGQLGFAPEDGVPPDYLSAYEYMYFVAGFRIRGRAERTQQVKDLLEWFELAPHKKIRDFSKGMKRRLILAQAFLGQPRLLILDEPLNGLDPLLIIKLRQKVESYRSGGGTLLFSSHILGEVEKTCTDVAILSQGKLMCFRSLTDLLTEYGSVEGAFTKLVGTA